MNARGLRFVECSPKYGVVLCSGRFHRFSPFAEVILWIGIPGKRGAEHLGSGYFSLWLLVFRRCVRRNRTRRARRLNRRWARRSKPLPILREPGRTRDTAK